MQKKITTMVITRVLTAFFFIAAIGLAVVLVKNIKSKIDEDERIDRQEQLVINKLKMIRDAEIAYLATNGKYTGSFDTLISFIDTGSIYITQRTEEIKMLAYGAEEITITIDTIGKVSVKDSVFVVREPMFCLAAGTIKELNISAGTTVKRGDRVATILSNKGKTIKLKAPYNAVIESIPVREGQQVEAKSALANLSYKRIGDITNLAYLPESKSNARFDIFAGKVSKGNVVVNVFEAKDTQPINPLRRKNKNENALRVGSRTEVSVAGNWE
ncbi:MAG: HlyD family efflux transporter periplasmic adaptor subunit [Cyclobacteriaceae bacterium]|nr:HlyD family efflux transporter periplasmic adaptor subunit [Cyclobacteriaceae bacterium]